MNYLLKNVFWIKGKTEAGAPLFFPVTFVFDKTQPPKIVTITKNKTYLFSTDHSEDQIKDMIVNCATSAKGFIDFVSSYGFRFHCGSTLFYGPKLLETAIFEYYICAKKDEFREFLNLEDSFFVKEYFDAFCKNHTLTGKQIVSYTKAFKKAAAFLDGSNNKPKNVEEEVLTHVCFNTIQPNKDNGKTL